MLSKIKIGFRLVLLIAIQIMLLVAIGITAVIGLEYASNTTRTLNDSVIEQVKLNQLNESIRVDLLEALNSVSQGKIGFKEGRANLLAAKNLFLNNWSEYKEDHTEQEVNDIEASLGEEFLNVVQAITSIEDIMQEENSFRLSMFLENNLEKLLTPFVVELNERVNEQQLSSEQLFEASLNTNKLFLQASWIIVVFGLCLASILGYFIYRSIERPIRNISSTVSEVSKGDYYARTRVTSRDELGALASAFNELLDDKVSTLVKAEQDNEKLNESVISLLTAVSKLSQRDLTVRVPVTEDVTGPVADALNQLTTEMSKVLQGVRRISEEVARACALVQAKSHNVIEVAANEQNDIDQTSETLAHAVKVMHHISELAQNCNVAAKNAIDTTHTALETVNETISGITGIREKIHETEKRIKRLGERSQEITRAVDLINSISERTHILALNASMHAASAGEAGRGFAVVADEVQRLAENARDATSQISTLVSNIQVETSDTVTTMNNVISQVVEGTRLAEQAGEQMQKTKDSTEHLVQSVEEIANSSQDQARISYELQGRATQIQESTRKTASHLSEQNTQTERLVEFSKSLLRAVQVFKLPKLEVIRNEAQAQGNQTGNVHQVTHKKAS